ncbi:S-adenosyl-L-methionine-dependent methyltransferase [Metschnikowia bicuspidata var. bicuspidata NRRL YB-4993]|uniref:S-adenosyl-L-methionine-dependent methyltransferase n=1 Tax=Metschnikowia bicuspidata var. bicuspidata NRRL YB-4993 TaxID=869754 RepID=A0A1A0HCZ4_9ASCO|nr:S-adenosyl-L-methionine-dependent methyltransferase [Metschnikowia bicuspidata var. bicuspidata NRRL YB-4993]OBA21808.1 S-adenosyl-L-methionine-dependent methyltransferase [Metschnikowia bicuspidata var. bicuspidata NRRL YB-4993]
MSSEGEGLGLVPRSAYDDQCTDPEVKTVIKLPKAVPGDVSTALLKRHHDYYAEAELVSVSRAPVRKGLRNDKLIICEHFGQCSGCQLQMLPYENQLEFKLDIIKRAYKYFYPKLDCSKVEGFGLVVDSPMQFSYRTKLTPHTVVPKKFGMEFLPVPVGFNNAVLGNPIVDINHCPIATSPINAVIPELKKQLNDKLAAKLESKSKIKVAPDFILRDSIRINHATGEYTNVCLTQRNNVVTEKVKEFVFQFEANEFFQNNRSILPTFIDFISFHLSHVNFKHIVDAYCGSGFLGISLSSQLPKDGKVFGIEISKKSIEYAKHNAGINGIPMPEKMMFVSGNSDSIFTDGNFLGSGVHGSNSVVIMNPSRKGSTDEFIQQLVDFRPKAIIYVSCNVFTQARDLASLQTFADRLGVNYQVKTITGFDFYPQTKHVESVAVLELQE